MGNNPIIKSYWKQVPLLAWKKSKEYNKRLKQSKAHRADNIIECEWTNYFTSNFFKFIYIFGLKILNSA